MTINTITLQLEGEQISAQVLYYRIKNFVDILHDVARNIGEELDPPIPTSAPVKWIVDSIRSDSPVTMTLRPEPVVEKTLLDVSERVVNTVATGFAVLQTETTALDLPRHFSLRILEDVHHLIRRGSDGITGVTVRTPDRAISFSGQADQNIRRFLNPAYESYGSVEGILEMVSAAGSMPRFSV